MVYNALDSQSQPNNVGQKFDPKEDLARTIKVVLTEKDFQFATEADALDQTKWQDAIEQSANRIFVLPFIYENEDNSEEAVRQDFPGGDSLKVRDGSYASRDKMHLSVADMAKMSSFKNKTWRLIKIDANGNILGTSPDDTVFKGFELTEFDVEKMNQTIGDVVRLVPIYYKERTPSEWTDKPVALQPLTLDTNSWDPRELDGLTDVQLTEISSIATKIIVKAEAYLKGEDLVGFDTAGDFIVKNGAGVVQSITITDNNDGTYDLDGTGFATGYTVQLGAAADLSQDGYEGIAAITITVV